MILKLAHGTQVEVKRQRDGATVLVVQNVVPGLLWEDDERCAASLTDDEAKLLAFALLEGKPKDTDALREMLSPLIANALQTDGAQHKQWYLEEIAAYLGLDAAALRDCAPAGIAP